MGGFSTTSRVPTGRRAFTAFAVLAVIFTATFAVPLGTLSGPSEAGAANQTVSRTASSGNYWFDGTQFDHNVPVQATYPDLVEQNQAFNYSFCANSHNWTRNNAALYDRFSGRSVTYALPGGGSSTVGMGGAIDMAEFTTSVTGGGGCQTTTPSIAATGPYLFNWGAGMNVSGTHQRCTLWFGGCGIESINQTDTRSMAFTDTRTINVLPQIIPATDFVTVGKGSSVSVYAVGNDTQSSGFIPPTITAVTNGAKGTCSFAGGTVTYTHTAPITDPATSDTCTYTVAYPEAAYAGGAPTRTAVVEVTIVPLKVPTPPVATLDFAQTDTNYPAATPPGSGPFPVTLDVLANDADPNQETGDADPVIVWVGFNGTDTGTDGVYDTGSAATQAGGTVACGTLPGAGPCTYTPPDNYSGTDTFLYQIRDAEGLLSVGVANVTVVGNQAPIVAGEAFEVLQDASLATFDVAPNDFDLESPALTYYWPNVPSGFSSTSTAGTFAYQPPSGFTGTAAITYWACDDHLLLGINAGDGFAVNDQTGTPAGDYQNKCAQGTATVNVVKPPPVPPVAAPDYGITDAWYSDNVPGTSGTDVDIKINLVANDFDPNGATGNAGAYPAEFTVTQVDPTSVNGGTVDGFNTVTGEVTYTPSADFCGTDTFTYTIRDIATNDDLTGVGVVSVQVLCNSAPIVVGELVTVAQSGTVSGDVSLNDADNDPQSGWTYSLVSGVSNGSLTFNADGTYSYNHGGSPTALTDSFTYRLCDGHQMLGTSDVSPASRCREATVTIQVTSTPQNAPVAVGDVGSVDSWYSADGQSQTSTTINVAANDSDADGNLDPSTASVLVGPSATQGAASMTNGVLTFQPADGYSGLVTVVYQICDNPAAATPAAATQLCAQAAVLITVTGNQPPLAIDDVKVVDEDSTGNSIDLAVNDLEIDGEGLTYTATPVVAPANGTVTISAAGVATYTPNAGFFGTDSFTYEVCDDHVAVANSGAVSAGGAWVRCTTATVNLVVTETPDAPPIALPDSANTTIDTAVTISVLDNDRDAEDGGPGLPVPPAAGIVAYDATTSTGATVTCTATECTYTPAAGFVGTDIFQYTIEDSYGNQAFTFVTVSVTDDNTPPVAIDDGANTLMETPVTTDVLANDSDADGDPLTLTLLTPTTAGGGTVTCTATDCTYTPATGFVGLDTYSYMIEDGAGGTAIATVSVNVTGGDEDGDGIPDVVEIEICGTPTCSDGTEDSDGDGVPDWIEILMGTDPTDPSDNPIGIDSDGGGIDDWVEYMSGTDPTDPSDDAAAQGTDSDGGGVPDWVEVIMGTDPTDASDDPLTLDTDGDGIPDWVEIMLGTDPYDPEDGSTSQDSDGGGVPDWVEVIMGTDPTDPSDDPLTLDSDGDGVPDWVEILMGTDPYDANDDPGSIDTDGDGVPDWVEIVMGTDPTDYNSNDTTTDSDLGGVPDWIEILMGTSPTDSRDDNTTSDADGDGYPDWTEYASCGNAYCYSGGDVDGNGIPDWVEVIMCGSAGCANATTDSDQDGVVDWKEVEICGTTTCAGENGIVVSDLYGNNGVPTVYTGLAWTMWAFTYTPGSVVTFELHSAPVFLGTVVANEEGVAILKAELPCDIDPGVHEVVAKGQTQDGQLLEQTYQVNVLPGAPCPDTTATGGSGSGSGVGTGSGGSGTAGGSTTPVVVNQNVGTQVPATTVRSTTATTAPTSNRSTVARAVAFTGSDPLIMTLLGAGLLLIGLATTRMVRRRRQS